MARFAAAWKAFWSVLGSAERAAAWQALARGEEGTAQPPAEPPSPEPDPSAGVADAVYTLALLQREGRLIDFLLEDIDQYADAQVGAAVRQIHANCRQVLIKHFGVARVREESEGDMVDIPPSFDPRHIRIVGKPAGDPPFRGAVRHHGWRASVVELPARHADLDPSIIAPAEVEVTDN